MRELQVCPHCGYDLVTNAPMMINDFTMNGPSHPLLYRGRRLHLTPTEEEICWSLMKSYPEPITVSVLMERIDSASDWNVINVMVCRIRKKLEAEGAPNIFETLRGRHAYRWLP
jgi:DNA-binding response OmpR family regulator